VTDDLTSMAAAGAGAHLWERSSLRPDDVDDAQLYDGFSILVLVWLEALGFCTRGGAAEFAACAAGSGRRQRRRTDRRLPAAHR
jgi:hypothetical protein